MDVDKKALYKVLARVRRKIKIKHRTCFEFVRKYCVIVQWTDPGSIALVRIVGKNPKFSRMLICFTAQGEAFGHYRFFIRIDGCHLKGLYKGILLTAVTFDANSGVLPLTTVVVDIEKKETWQWFLQHCKYSLRISLAHKKCFMFDKQKEILPALDAVFPEYDHRYEKLLSLITICYWILFIKYLFIIG